MKPITDYQDYRLYMRDFYAERKASSAFSWRAFAKLAGFASSGYLKLVCDGKTRLSRVGLSKVAKAMKLAKIQTEYFRAMVAFSDEPDVNKRAAAFEKMQAIAEENKVRIVGESAYRYFDTWWNPILREMAPMLAVASPTQISNLLYGGVTRFDVQQSLDFLVEAGFLTRTGHNVYEQTDKAVAGSSDAIPKTIRMMQKQMALLGARIIDELPKSERNFSGLTVAANKQTYERVVEELTTCRKKIASIVANAENGNRIYRLNLHFFPVTKEIFNEK